MKTYLSMFVLKNHDFDRDGRCLGDTPLRERLSERIMTVGFDPHDERFGCPICGRKLDPAFDNVYLAQDREPVGCDSCLTCDYINDEDELDRASCPICGEISESLMRDQEGEIVGCDRCLIVTVADD